jgi:hypothetical protein
LRNDIGYWPELDGRFYGGGGGRHLFKKVVDGRWEPWNPQLQIVAPRIQNPIALYARRLGFGPNVELLTYGPIGFDLIVSDWVEPHGKGKNPDFVLSHLPGKRAEDVNSPFDSVFTLTFTNRGDGILSKTANPLKRLLELPRSAPEDGYEPKLERSISWAGNNTPIHLGTRDDQNYFFRVRTVLDQQGNVVSALYGKIYGDINFFAPPSSHGMVRFTYYLNPTPLDRNLEFDPKRNLLSDRLPGTNVSEP